MSHLIGFLPVDSFPSNWSLCHFILETTGLIKHWALDLQYRNNIGMYWLYLWLLIYLYLVYFGKAVFICILDKMQYFVIALFTFVLGKIQNSSRSTVILNNNITNNL